MKKRAVISLMVFALVLTGIGAAGAYEALVGPTGVLKYNAEKAYDGYTVFSPMFNCKTTYLIDMEGNLVHKWDTDYPPGLFGMLLPNGNLLRAGRMKEAPTTIGGTGGIIQELDWSGKAVWEYKLCTPTQIQHHTFCRMPNGNTLILAWEFKTIEEAIAKGRDANTVPSSVFTRGQWYKGFWVDFVREVDKDGKTVWEWHTWDHIGKGPTKLDINYILPKPVGEIYADFDWSHFNTVDYIPETDQVILNSRNIGESYLVNHKTGVIEWRWGNPSAYGQGRKPGWYDNGDQQLFGPHHATRLENGNIQIFDNGSERPEGNRSAVVEVEPKTGKVVWEYHSKDSNSFYSYRQGAAQRLPNGNVLVTSSNHGHVFEVTPKKEIVWDWVSPVHDGKTKCYLEDGDSKNMMNNTLHRAYRYGKDYPGLKGKDLSKKVPFPEECPQFFKVYKTK